MNIRNLILGTAFMILSMINNVQAQCPNLDFSSGDFTNWQAYKGDWNGGSYNVSPCLPDSGRHTIMDAAALTLAGQLYDERCSPIPKVPNGFQYAAKLGNANIGGQMEALEYTMTVDSSNSLLMVHFAWVMENPNHSPNEQPQFTMQIRDSLGRPISALPCGNVNFIAGNTTIPLACTGNSEARNWTTIGYSLELLIGQKIKIYFETRDCSQGDHFGYAYIVAECRPMRTDLAVCSGQSIARMTAPDGFAGYTWVRSSSPSWVNSSQRFVVSDVIDGEIFTCRLMSELGCESVLKIKITKTPATITNYSATICQGSVYTDSNFVNLTQQGVYYDTLKAINDCDSIIICLNLYVTAAPITNYFAIICQGITYTDDNFTNLTQAGNYGITLKTADGCDSIIRLNLTVTYPPPAQEICMVSVDENNHNEVVWKELDEVVSYNIYREGMQSGQYDLMANINYSNPNRWTDTASNAKTRSYRYKISAIDTCGNESELSNAHRTMHLTINAGQNNSWNLIWTAYEGTGYSTYNIYRTAGNKHAPLTLISTIPAGNTSYSDFAAPSGSYLYYVVEIVLDNPCVLTKSLSSIRSNIATNEQDEVGIVETRHATSLRVYPNPTTGQLHITMGHAPLWEDAVIEIYSVVGQVVLSAETLRSLMTLTSLETDGITIDVTSLANGIYFLKIGEKTVKFVKE